MAEINKLAVGEALDKLRRPDVQSKEMRFDEKMTALDEDIQRMRAMRTRLERDQRAAEMSTQTANNRTGPFSKLRWLAILAILAPVLLVLIILYAALVR